MKRYLESLAKINPNYYKALGLATIVGGSSLFVQPSTDQEIKVSKAVTPTQSQRNNYTMPHRTCNSSSNAMFLSFYRPLLERESNSVDDDTYLASVLRRGDTIYHEVQTASLKAYGLNTVWRTDSNLSRVKKVAEQGMPVVVNILHRGRVEGHGLGALRGGHIIVLRNYDPSTKMFDVADPYGNLAAGYPNDSNPKAGEYKMSATELKTRWQGGYRLLSSTQAAELKLDPQ